MTYSGTAIGSARSTASVRRRGRSVRSTHHAAASPMTTQAAVTATVSWTLLTSSSPTRGRHSRRRASDQPTSETCWRMKTSGSRASPAATTAPSSAGRGGRTPDLPGVDQRSPTSCRSRKACRPSPSWATLSAGGISEANGRWRLVLVTPGRSGYS